MQVLQLRSKGGSSMRLYHGSNTIVDHPRILTHGHYKDFGYGFYCTELKEQAVKWALTRKNRHVVNLYHYTEDTNLNIKHFPSLSEDWLNFIANCRHGVEHSYDIVEGPMADDTIWDYVEDFIRGDISREAFWALAKFKYPTHQIVFCTEKALDSLKFYRSCEL